MLTDPLEYSQDTLHNFPLANGKFALSSFYCIPSSVRLSGAILTRDITYTELKDIPRQTNQVHMGLFKNNLELRIFKTD